MPDQQAAAARRVVERLQAILTESGQTLSAEHGDELALLIESALDAAVVERLEQTAVKLERMAHDLRHDELFFSD